MTRTNPRAALALFFMSLAVARAQTDEAKTAIGQAKDSVTAATQALDAGDAGRATDLLGTAREALVPALNFTLRSTTLVKDPAEAMGVYEVHPGTYKATDSVYVYTEPVNYTIGAEKEGRYPVVLTGDIELLDINGRALVKKPNFFNMNLHSRHRLRELFINASLSLASIPPGEYKLLLRVRDSKDRVAESTVPVRFE